MFRALAGGEHAVSLTRTHTHARRHPQTRCSSSRASGGASAGLRSRLAGADSPTHLCTHRGTWSSAPRHRGRSAGHVRVRRCARDHRHPRARACTRAQRLRHACADVHIGTGTLRTRGHTLPCRASPPLRRTRPLGPRAVPGTAPTATTREPFPQEPPSCPQLTSLLPCA